MKGTNLRWNLDARAYFRLLECCGRIWCFSFSSQTTKASAPLNWNEHAATWWKRPLRTLGAKTLTDVSPCILIQTIDWVASSRTFDDLLGDIPRFHDWQLIPSQNKGTQSYSVLVIPCYETSIEQSQNHGGGNTNSSIFFWSVCALVNATLSKQSGFQFHSFDPLIIWPTIPRPVDRLQSGLPLKIEQENIQVRKI